MKRSLTALLCLFIAVWCAACGGGAASQGTGGISINVSNAFSTIEAGGAPVTLTAVVTGASNNGLTWTLSNANATCSPACGTLKAGAPPSLSAVYTPPATVPLNQTATITARSVADNSQIFAFNFQIVPPITVSISSKFSSVNVAGPAQNLSATVTNDPSMSGVNWTITVGGMDCQQPAQGGCGTLTVGTPNTSATYTPPATPPAAANAMPTITATSVKNPAKTDSFTFNIVTPPITVTIQNKFQTAMTGGMAIPLNATITNDFLNKGLTWSITVNGVDCQQPAQGGCGTLTPGTPSTSATYTPPATPPSAANASPTITVTSVADPTKSDSFNFSISTPPITVTITNKFPPLAGNAHGIFTGSQPVTVNASVTNDFLNQGVNWSMTVGGAACTSACGTLTPVGSPSTSATYTPPVTPAAGPTPSPTIAATAVSDNAASDSFTFALVIPDSLVHGNYAFLLRGYDASLNPMALAGVLIADGMGNISGGKYDLNDNTTVTSVAGPLSGSYTVDTSFNSIPRVTFTISAGGTTTVLKGALSSDGTRAKVIELDGSMALNAGTLIQEDPTAASALANSASPTAFAFGLDSDAPLDGRVVEAGQFILGATATSITGGIADEGQAGAANPIFGGVTAAPIAPASSSATAPDASGRGTLTLSIGGNATQYAYYVVNSSQLNLIEIDAGGALKTVQSGTARNQSALNANSINAASVVALTGITSAGTPPALSSDVIIGVLTNAAGAAPLANFDSNNAGTVAIRQTSTGSFAVPYDATTGRVVIVGAFGNLFPDAVVYLYGSGSGFIADITPSTSGVNHGFSGPLVPQSAPPAGGFTLQSLSGNSIGLGGGSSNSSMANFDIAANFDGAGNYSSELDFTINNAVFGGYFAGTSFSLSNTYSIDDMNLGHGTMIVISSLFGNLSAGNHADAVSLYLVGPDQFVAIESQGQANGGSASDILFFDPQ